MKSEQDRILLEAFCHMMGIVPLSTDVLRSDVDRLLSGLSPGEARTMKRKFRKVWRKVVKSSLRQYGLNKPSLMKVFGLTLGAEHAPPTRDQKLNRKRAVWNHVYHKYVIPAKKLAQGPPLG